MKALQNAHVGGFGEIQTKFLSEGELCVHHGDRSTTNYDPWPNIVLCQPLSSSPVVIIDSCDGRWGGNEKIGPRGACVQTNNNNNRIMILCHHRRFDIVLIVASHLYRSTGSEQIIDYRCSSRTSVLNINCTQLPRYRESLLFTPRSFIIYHPRPTYTPCAVSSVYCDDVILLSSLGRTWTRKS